ncbi:MAG: DUF2934 domain-containing protein [Pseudomonadota bacterium]
MKTKTTSNNSSFQTKKTTRNRTQRSRTYITAEERDRKIAETAYFMAEERGFNGNDHFEDWVQAEKTIDSRYVVDNTIPGSDPT